MKVAHFSSHLGLFAFHHFIGYQWCHLLRHPKGLARTRWLGLMACWLDYLCWFHAGLRRRKRVGHPSIWDGGKDFWRPPMMLKSKWFHLVCCFFFSLHILVCFILVWCIRCLVVSRLVMLEPYSKKQTRKDKLYGWSLWTPVIFVISWCACWLSTPVRSTLDNTWMCDRYISQFV